MFRTYTSLPLPLSEGEIERGWKRNPSLILHTGAVYLSHLNTNAQGLAKLQVFASHPIEKGRWGRIVAIGGGEIGRPGYPVETINIDKETIKLTGKKNPKLLFVGTASGDSEVYRNVIDKYFGERFGCRVSHLVLTKHEYTRKDLENVVLYSDIIYVGGGSTMRMIKLWKKVGLDIILKKASRKGIVLSGVSAGANCWFKYSNSDSLKYEKLKKKDLILLKCLGFVNAVMCPHYDVEKARQVSLKKQMKSSKLVAIALGNCVALEIVGNKYRLLTSKKGAVGYKIFWKDGKYFKIKIDKGTKFKSLASLIKK